MKKSVLTNVVVSLVTSLVVLFAGLYVLDRITQKRVATLDFDKSYALVAGVIRNSGTGWGFIQDKGHETIGLDSVTQDEEKIIIKYEEKTKVNSVAVTVDETMASEGYSVGASVGFSEMSIFIFDKEGNLVNPTEYQSQNGNIWIQGIFKN